MTVCHVCKGKKKVYSATIGERTCPTCCGTGKNKKKR